MSEVMEAPSTALAISGVSLPAQRILAADTNDLLRKLAEEVASHKPDVSTPKGRKEIASLAYKVSTTKADLIRLGKGLTEEWRKATKAVNEECNVLETNMDALRDKVRAPLTEFENREKARIKGHEDALAAMEYLFDGLPYEPTPEHIRQSLEQLDVHENARDWQEFSQRAHDLHAEIGAKLSQAVSAAVIREEAAAEAERRRLAAEEEARQQAARQQREREAEIARRAAEEARLAEERRQQEAQARERQRMEEERLAAERAAQAERDRIEAERQAAERAAHEAQERAERAERDRVESERRAAERARAAAAQAERDRMAAVEAERQRVAAEKAAEEHAAAERARNLEIKRKVNFDAAAALVVKAGLTEQQAQRVIISIAKREIPAVEIRY